MHTRYIHSGLVLAESFVEIPWSKCSNLRLIVLDSGLSSGEILKSPQHCCWGSIIYIQCMVFWHSRPQLCVGEHGSNTSLCIIWHHICVTKHILWHTNTHTRTVTHTIFTQEVTISLATDKTTSLYSAVGLLVDSKPHVLPVYTRTYTWYEQLIATNYYTPRAI